MKILITGADGFIAHGVIKELLNHDVDITAAGLHECGISSPRLKELVGDVLDASLTYEDLGEPDVVLHLAWRKGFEHYDDAHIGDLNRHYEFLRRMARSGVKRLAVMGTMHEVGYFEGKVCDDTPCNPITPYGVAKNALRQLTEIISNKYGIEYQWLRGFYLVNNDGAGNSIFSKIVQASNKGQDTFPFTSGTCKYDFLPYEAFCHQVASAVLQNELCGIINICSGIPVALGEYVEEFISNNKLGIRLAYGSYPDRPYDSPAIWGDNEKIKEILANEKRS